MSVLIKGMEMPKNCHECPLLYVTSICDGFKDCPIVTVPAHGRLIDADEMLEADRRGFESAQANALSDKEKEGLKRLHDALKDFIEESPTVIEAEKGENNADN